MTINSLDFIFIHGHIHDRSYKKVENLNFVSIILHVNTGKWNIFHVDTICKPGWFSLPTLGCYYMFQEKATWVGAGEKCSEMNGTLASWETRNEFTAMKTYLENNFCKLLVLPQTCLHIFIVFIRCHHHCHRHQSWYHHRHQSSVLPSPLW